MNKLIRNTLSIILVLLLSIMLLSSCDATDPVGLWKVNEARAGVVIMTPDDAKAMGLVAIGTFKLNKSGSCEIMLIGEEYTGEWSQADDGTITIKYGEDKVLTATIDEEGNMSMQDPEGTTYKLKK